ncbi:Adp-ribosylation/crystallin j1 [Globisporangium polare]
MRAPKQQPKKKSFQKPKSSPLWTGAILCGLAALVGYATLQYASWGFGTIDDAQRVATAHSATSLDAHKPPPAQATSSSFSTTMALSVPKQRAVAAVIGGFVSDAATMGLHWIYDDAKLAGLVAQQPNGPEFFNPPSCPFYSYPSGALSPYGDEVLPLLQDVATRGEFDPVEFGTVSYHAAKAYTGRLNHIFKELVVKGDAGLKYPNLASESKDSQGATKAPVLVARYIDAPVDVLLEKVVQATKVHQIGVEAEEAAVATALLLSQVVHGVSIKDAIASLVSNDKVGSATREQVKQVIDDVNANKFASAIAAIGAYGKPCSLPGVLQGSLYVLLTSTSYVDAVRANMAAGGDNCSRSIVIGAISAAAATPGSDPVPAEWKQKTTRYEEIKAFAEKLVQ